MTLDEYIETLEKPNCEVTVDIAELLGLLKELKGARKLIKRQSQCIESQARYIAECVDRR